MVRRSDGYCSRRSITTKAEEWRKVLVMFSLRRVGRPYYYKNIYHGSGEVGTLLLNGAGRFGPQSLSTLSVGHRSK